MTRIKILKYLTFGISCILLHSCVKSKTYGDWQSETLLFESSEVKCSFSQFIDGSSCAANVYLYLTSKTNDQIEITNLTGQMKWELNDKITPSPFLLSHIEISILSNKNIIADSSFFPGQIITDKFKTISGMNSSLIYVLEFSDSTYNNIPMSVNKILVEIEMDIKSNEILKHYMKTIVIDERIHYNIIPYGAH